jgi:hypothetical protein
VRCALPYPIRYRPDAALNPAVFHDAMPASTIKPIMAGGVPVRPRRRRRWLASELADVARTPDAVPSIASLRGQLARSDSARFLDRMFCADRDFAPCARPWAIQAAASAFGWNDGCAAASESCGRRDLLFGAGAEARADGGRARSRSRFRTAACWPSPPAIVRRVPADARARASTSRRSSAARPAPRRQGVPTATTWEKCGRRQDRRHRRGRLGQGHARAERARRARA